MKNIVYAAAIAVLATSCAPPMPPNVAPPSANIQRDTIEYDSTVQTVIVNNERDIQIKIAGTTLYVEDQINGTFIQREIEDKVSIHLVTDKDSIIYLSVGKTVMLSQDTPPISTNVSTQVPFKLIKKGVILVEEGATLLYISRYYNVPVAKLMEWNNIKDRNLIISHSQIKIACGC